MYIDTHCHLDIITHDINNIQQLLKIANKNFVKYLFNISVNIKDFFVFKKLLSKFDNIFFSFGISPNDIDNKIKEFTFNDIENFFKKAINKPEDKIKIIGIGEIGLDYFHKFCNPETQKHFFNMQLELATKYNLPVIIHTRDAFNDTFDILKNFKKNIIFHCYSGGIYETESILKNFENAYFSFAGNLTYKNATDLVDSIKILPQNRFFFETDSPYLSPVPFRGKKNQPANVIYIYQFASKLLNIELSELKKIVFHNVNNAFNINLK